MKLIYFGSTATSDCDFPLLRQFEKEGLDYVAYYIISDWNKQKGIISVDEIQKKDVILKATEVPAFSSFKDYIDLNRIFVVNLYHNKRYQWQSWVTLFKTLNHMRKQKADIFHCVWPLSKVDKVLYLLNYKRVLTVHDPIPHSGQSNFYDELHRKLAFKLSDKLILLNPLQKQEFCKKYKINDNRVGITHLGEYDCLRYMKFNIESKPHKYILFFGQIQHHKGVDLLLQAMVKVHKSHPDVKLIIAGKGNFHFDITPYKSLNYIEFRNYYVKLPELASLLHGCLFAVCPYRDATQSGVVQTAFSVDVPLIVTNVGALPIAVKDGVTGTVIPPNNHEALANAITYLLDNPQTLADYKKNIDKIWRPQMSWTPIAKDFIRYYKELIK